MAVIPKELDELVQEYLTDGIITAKERQVLLKKAVSLGLDQDEVDLYIDAQQQKVDMAVNAAATKQRGKTCPHCGTAVQQLADTCPACGQPITVEATKELEKLIEALEDALVKLKQNLGWDTRYTQYKAEVEKNIRKAELYYSGNPKIKILLEATKQELAEIETKKVISARKEFISEHKEFIIVAVSFVLLMLMGLLINLL